MIWYFLYPLRGTSQPPRLSANHPIRRAFFRHGKTTAQHWLITMLVSVAIAMGFSYPTIFLSENPTAGFAAYPHHVWTTARPFMGEERLIDVEMRQIWVHGSYMNALNKSVLNSALGIQQAIVGPERLTSVYPTLNDQLRTGAISWGYHSPLMYWNNSADTISGDEDVVRTINDQSRTSSSLNVALRPASVFAGKRFDRKKLRAADALVITLMNKAGDGVGGRWEDSMEALASGACQNCTLFPHDGRVTRNKVYEFSFVPLSLQENIALTFAYTCMALYVLLSLRRLKAFHSRFGLVVTAITQMTCSVLASVTICGILKINLSTIPQNAYPFVVLVVGLENMFRLINAVLAYPATMATDQRIANALGDVGPVSVATAGQNLIILSLLSYFVSPGVAAFCAFACIATLFDAFFLLTFFVAVLNVDIRRFELQDTLARSTQQRARRRPSPVDSRSLKHTWFDALVQGRLPFSTRMAGTAVTTTFILSLNYHFFERHEKVTSLRHLLGLARGGSRSVADFDTFTPPPMNATLTPGEWMRMQDFDTAKEVMRLAKPGADSFVIRVFAPLIVVLADADRTGAPLGTEAWVHALRSYAIHHFYPVAVAVVFAVAFVAVLMNFLLYSEAGEEPFPEERERQEDGLSLRSVNLPHKLDIIKLAGTEKAHFVTVGLDRTVAVSLFDRAQQDYKTIGVPAEVTSSLRWPVRDCLLDDSGDYLALHCADDQIVFFSCATGSLLEQSLQYPDDNPPVLFRFFRVPGKETGARTWLVILTSGGRLLTTCMGEKGDRESTRLSERPLVDAALIASNTQSRKLYHVTEDAQLVGYSWGEDGWKESCSGSLPLDTRYGGLSSAVSITTQQDLGHEILMVRSEKEVLFVDSSTLNTLSKIDLDTPLADMTLGNSAHCAACGSVALRSVGLISEMEPDGSSEMTVLSARDGDLGGALCLRHNTSSCHSFAQATKATHKVQNPAGSLCALDSQAVLGLRRLPPLKEDATPAKQASSAQTRHRRRASTRPSTTSREITWEAFKVSLNGEIESTPVLANEGSEAEGCSLYVNSAGPAVALDHQSSAVAFGNQVKVIRSSRRGSLAGKSDGPALQRHGSTSKRRLTLRKGQ
ncbi:hypothetical protein KC333_g8943 [Hortaea werneckii]|nr:hypothetical protein KC333_g8943 [Hortaea werneckii]KAI7303915.1 hypothetical protein KC326_g8586 [Hortaea werneckii]